MNDPFGFIYFNNLDNSPERLYRDAYRHAWLFSTELVLQ